MECIELSCADFNEVNNYLWKNIFNLKFYYIIAWMLTCIYYLLLGPIPGGLGVPHQKEGGTGALPRKTFLDFDDVKLIFKPAYLKTYISNL